MPDVYTLYVCCPKCKGIVGKVFPETDAAVVQQSKDAQQQGFVPFVAGADAKKGYDVGYKLSSGCIHPHDYKAQAAA